MVEGIRLDRVYSALAHPARREILEIVGTAPGRVTELAQPFDMSLAAVSKHIRVLEEANLVRRTVRGRDHFLAAHPHGLDDAYQWIDGCRSFWESRIDALEQLFRNGGER